MAGTFELFADEDSRIRFRLVAPDGSVLAVSGQYPDKYHAAAAIKDVRECAGTGLITDLAPAGLALARPPRRGPHVRPLGTGKAGSLGAA
ncbi:YegP family protein [Arthrobacter sp. SD76]|uniref:YegP family protein n=1 Tax=Arthrobacter sp. SD76 TaxID=3415007 RepID=UPI003C762A7A